MQAGEERSDSPVRIVLVDLDAVNRLASLCLVDASIMQMVVHNRLRAASLDPRQHDSLMLAAVLDNARAALVLPEATVASLPNALSTVDMKPGKARQQIVKQILDTSTMLTAHVASDCARKLTKATRARLSERSRAAPLHCVTLLLQESTVNLYFGHAQMRHAGHDSGRTDRWMDISPLNLSPLFAAGQLLAMSCFDRFVVEALFSPQVVPLMRMFTFGDARGNRLCQVACPSRHVGRRFEEAQSDMLKEQAVLIGLLRVPVNGCSYVAGENGCDDALPDTTLPYVMTNPDPGTVVLRSSDLLFMVGQPDKQHDEPMETVSRKDAGRLVL